MLHSSPLNGSLHFWNPAHELLGILFTVSAIVHIVLNRKALVSHIRGRAGWIAGLSRETFWAVALVGIMLLLAVGHTLHEQ